MHGFFFFASFLFTFLLFFNVREERYKCDKFPEDKCVAPSLEEFLCFVHECFDETQKSVNLFIVRLLTS
jgi:hypothetical protein